MCCKWPRFAAVAVATAKVKRSLIMWDGMESIFLCLAFSVRWLCVGLRIRVCVHLSLKHDVVRNTTAADIEYDQYLFSIPLRMWSTPDHDRELFASEMFFFAKYTLRFLATIFSIYQFQFQ